MDSWENASETNNALVAAAARPFGVKERANRVCVFCCSDGVGILIQVPDTQY